jgi:SAM-dependent methyltransferase
MGGPNPTLRCPCVNPPMRTAFTYDAPPAGETRFAFPGLYARRYDRCDTCGHWFSRHAIDLSGLYGGGYADATYGAKMRETYDRIMALPAEKSDNTGRVASILRFAATHRLPSGRTPRLLDIGSGLAVFPARMKTESGWDCTALDPDARMAAHAREVAGVAAIAGDFLTLPGDALGRFDVITLNKVLEHVEDPVAMLARCEAALARGGFVYVELPDGEAAAAEGPGREEFFIEHHHVFSPASFALMAARAGFSPVLIERLREPSGKFTLRGFLTAAS